MMTVKRVINYNRNLFKTLKQYKTHLQDLFNYKQSRLSRFLILFFFNLTILLICPQICFEIRFVICWFKTETMFYYVLNIGAVSQNQFDQILTKQYTFEATQNTYSFDR